MIGKVAAGALLAAGLILAPTAAQATDQPTYVLAAWSIGNPDSIWETPQELETFVMLDEPTLDALDESLPCGGYFQIDLYYADQDSAALLAGGLLYGPQNPKEPHAYVVDGNPWKFVQTAECAVKPEPRPWATSSTSVTCEAATDYVADGFFDLDFDPVANVWTERPEPTVVHESSSTRTPNAEELAAACPPEEQLPTLPSAELAETGLTPAGSWLLIGALLALIFGGVGVLIRGVVRRS